MKFNNEELIGSVRICVDFLTRALDKNNLQNETDRFKKDYSDLRNIVTQMSMYLAEFNFYPSEYYSHCCQVAFFTSLTGSRWNLKNSERISFEEMFRYLIRHCQGTCSGTTTYAVLLVDNWDDDIAQFWRPNIEELKRKGIIVEVRMLMGNLPNTYRL